MARFWGPAKEDGSRDCLITGYISREPVMEYTSQKHIPKVSFSVCIGQKTYQNCLALGNGAITELCAALEKKDVVICSGTWSRRSYNKRDGREAQWEEILLDSVIPMPTLDSAAPASPKPAQGPIDVNYDEEAPGEQLPL